MKLPWDSAAQRQRAEGKYVREKSADPYHTSRWTKLSSRFRDLHPLCAECERQGRLTAATCVDHIIPWPVCGDFYDESNLQALCNECNNLKGQRDKQKYKSEFAAARRTGGR